MRQAYIDIVLDCNLKCVFCSRGDREGIRDKEEIKDVIKKYWDQGYKKLMLSGGEPLLHPDLPELVSFSSNLGFEVAIQTNGTLLDEKKLIILKKAGLDQIIFSIHSHFPVMVDRIMRGNGVLKKQLDALKRAHELNFTTNLTTVIMRQNYRILPEFYEFMIHNFPFVNFYTLNFVDPIGRAWKNKWVVPKYSEIERHLMKALTILYKAKKEFRVERVPLCYMAEFAEYSTETRRIIHNDPSVVFRGKESISYVTGYFEREYVRGEACKFCWLRSICPGVDKEYAQIHGTDELYPIFVDPEKISRMAGED